MTCFRTWSALTIVNSLTTIAEAMLTRILINFHAKLFYKLFRLYIIHNVQIAHFYLYDYIS